LAPGAQREILKKLLSKGGSESDNVLFGDLVGGLIRPPARNSFSILSAFYCLSLSL
jgi:hypothetical protein